MEHFLTAEEVIEKHINKSSLIFAFVSGELTAYDKNSFDPIDGKELFDFFKHLGNVFYLDGGPFFNEADHPLYQEDRYYEKKFNDHGIWTDPTTKIRYAASLEHSTFKRVPWVQLHKEIKFEIELSHNDPEYFEEFRRSIFIIFREQLDEIQDGWGAKQAEEIINESLFKLSDIKILLSKNENTGKIEGTSVPCPKKNEATSLEELTYLSLEKLWPESNRQQKDGFEIFKKSLTKHFKTGVRAAVAVLAYCQEQLGPGEKLQREDLENLFDENIKTPPGGEKLEQYKGQITRQLAQDIYFALPEKYRHLRGEKKETKPPKPTEP